MHNKMYHSALYLTRSVVLTPYVSIKKSSVQKPHAHEYSILKEEFQYLRLFKVKRIIGTVPSAGGVVYFSVPMY